MRQCLVLAVSIFLAATMNMVKLSAQEGPSSADTVEWIRSHLPSPACGQYRVTPVRFTDPVARGYRQSMDNQCLETMPSVVAFAAVTSVTVKRVSITSSSGIAWHLAVILRDDSNQSVGVSYPDGDNDDANRMAKALRHMAELNGAKIAKDDIF